jgi:DNA polymerase III alpha subunit
MDILPIIFDDSSRRSLLTFDPPEDYKGSGPIPIVKLLKDAGLTECFFVSPNFHSYIKALKLCDKHKITLHFGLELWVTDDAAVLDESSRANESKIIVWQKNSAGYEDLIRLYNAFQTHKEYFYYHMRYDWKGVKAHWTDNLELALPFFDNCLSRNTLNYGSQIVPDFPEKPILFREISTDHPHEPLINMAIDRFNIAGDHEVVNTKSVYYVGDGDFKAYMVYRCIHNHSRFAKPELDFMCSSAFSWNRFLTLRGTWGNLIEP